MQQTQLDNNTIFLVAIYCVKINPLLFNKNITNVLKTLGFFFPFFLLSSRRKWKGKYDEKWDITKKKQLVQISICVKEYLQWLVKELKKELMKTSPDLWSKRRPHEAVKGCAKINVWMAQSIVPDMTQFTTCAENIL